MHSSFEATEIRVIIIIIIIIIGRTPKQQPDLWYRHIPNAMYSL
jgi:Sec-independent protein translocase protein TatA